MHRVKHVLAHNFWVLGYPDQAMVMAAEAVQEAADLNQPFTFCYVLNSGVDSCS